MRINTLLLGFFFSVTVYAFEVEDIVPQSGQPAANVLASHDLWGNPTFIGGITNKGPDSGSVW